MSHLITREQLEKEWANEPTVVMSREQFILKCLAMQDNGLEVAAGICDSYVEKEKSERRSYLELGKAGKNFAGDANKRQHCYEKAATEIRALKGA